MIKLENANIKNGYIFIGGSRVAIDGFNIQNKLGSGANGTVFRAIDVLLGRVVAIKIWNEHGKKRSRAEISKIANFQHPLIVSTYAFNYAGDTAYAVMEFVPGSNGKEWLKKGPTLESRIRFWGRYVDSLRVIHTANEVHGDPHLGNVILNDGSKMGISTARESDSKFVFKIADTGTSVFWDEHAKFQERERDLILETASKLFRDFGLGSIFVVPECISYQAALRLVDQFVEYLWRSHCCADWDRRSENASIIASQVVATPLFEIESVIAQCVNTGVTDRGRLVRRLNSIISGNNDFYTNENEITRENYGILNARRSKLIRSLQDSFGYEGIFLGGGWSSYRNAPWY